MKAEVTQQRSLIELTDIDAESGRLEHRAKNLAEQQRLDAVESEHRNANDGLAAVNLALEDLEAEVAKFESHIASYAKQYGQKVVVWDNGYTSIGDDQFGQPTAWADSSAVQTTNAVSC